MESKKEIGQRGQQFFWQVHGQTSLTASHDITSFVGQRRDVMRWPPAVVSETEAQDPLEQGWTHTDSRSRRRCMKGRWLLFFLKNRRHAV